MPSAFQPIPKPYACIRLGRHARDCMWCQCYSMSKATKIRIQSMPHYRLKPNSTSVLTRKQVFSNTPIQPKVHESRGYPPIPCNYTWTAKSSATFEKHPRYPSTLNMSPNEINGNHPSQQRLTGTLIHRLLVAFAQAGLRLQNCLTIFSRPPAG
jgi:hypothetical protein